jgi:protein-S-isoprenylcysteine O-methyltransferase Ste14
MGAISMTIIGIIATTVRVAWAVFEGPRLIRDAKVTATADRHSARVWDLANGVELIGIVCGLIGFGSMQLSSHLIAYFGLAAMVAGIAIRWSAIRALGQYFSGKVLLQPGHQLVRTGLYKYVRHPAYTGTLLAHLGLGLSFANWISLGFSVIPFVIAAWYRMRVEDEALRKAFGVAYLDYSKHAKRLIPKLY